MCRRCKFSLCCQNVSVSHMVCGNNCSNYTYFKVKCIRSEKRRPKSKCASACATKLKIYAFFVDVAGCVNRTESLEIETGSGWSRCTCTDFTTFFGLQNTWRMPTTHMCVQFSVTFLLNEHILMHNTPSEGQKFQKKYNVCIFIVLLKFDTSKGETHPFPFSISISSSHSSSFRFTLFSFLHTTWNASVLESDDHSLLGATIKKPFGWHKKYGWVRPVRHERTKPSGFLFVRLIYSTLKTASFASLVLRSSYALNINWWGIQYT